MMLISGDSHMKRILLEWSLIVSVGMALALSTLWVYSRFYDRTTYHLRFPTSRSVQDDLHVLVSNGDLTVCDQFDVDASGNVRPLIVHSRDLTPSDILRGDRAWQVTIPGLDLRHYRHAPSLYVIWSLRLSLLIPVAMSFLIAVWFRRCLNRLRSQVEPEPDRAQVVPANRRGSLSLRRTSPGSRRGFLG
jgi:hypothetical protein